MQAPDPIRLYKAATRHVKAATLNLNHLLETQKRLTATKDGPFMDPGSPPPVLAVPFVPPSWAAIMTGGYRHHRLQCKLHANHPPSRKETRRANRANRRKTPRSCAGPHHGPDRPLSGSLHSVLRFTPTHFLARKRVGPTIARHPVAAPVPTLGPAVDLVLVHLTPLRHIHHTPPLGLIATTTVTDTEREAMTIGVDHHPHHHRIPPVQIFPTYRFGAIIRTTKASASVFAHSIKASSVIEWSGNIPPSRFALLIAWSLL